MSNNRSVNILLFYMAMVPENCIESFKELVPELVNNQQFMNYLNELPFQTIQMMNKNTLVVDGGYNDKIIGISRSASSFIDDHFYRKRMQEETENDSYKHFPVKISALKMGWLFEPSGKNYF